MTKKTLSNRPEVFCKKGVPKNFAKFTRKHQCWTPYGFLMFLWGKETLQLYLKRDSNRGVFL